MTLQRALSSILPSSESTISPDYQQFHDFYCRIVVSVLSIVLFNPSLFLQTHLARSVCLIGRFGFMNWEPCSTQVRQFLGHLSLSFSPCILLSCCSEFPVSFAVLFLFYSTFGFLLGLFLASIFKAGRIQRFQKIILMRYLSASL